MAARNPGESDLLSLEELATSLASLEDGPATAIDAAARHDIFRRQLSRALTERHSDLLAQIRRPSDSANSEQLEGLRSQLLGALLERTASAAVDDGLISCNFDTASGPTANGLAWAISHAATGGAGGSGGGCGRGGIDVAQLLAANTRLRAFAPTYKRKHEGTDAEASANASRPKQAQRHDGAEPPADQPQAPAPLANARDDDYDGDDDDDDDIYAPTSYRRELCDEPAATWPQALELGFGPRGGAAVDVRMCESGAPQQQGPDTSDSRELGDEKTPQFDVPRTDHFAVSARGGGLLRCADAGNGAAAAVLVLRGVCQMDVE